MTLISFSRFTFQGRLTCCLDTERLSFLPYYKQIGISNSSQLYSIQYEFGTIIIIRGSGFLLAFNGDDGAIGFLFRARQRTGELGVGAIRPDLVKPSVIGRAGGFQFIGEG